MARGCGAGEGLLRGDTVSSCLEPLVEFVEPSVEAEDKRPGWKRRKIIKLRREGKSYSTIRDEVGCSLGYVRSLSRKIGLGGRPFSCYKIGISGIRGIRWSKQKQLWHVYRRGAYMGTAKSLEEAKALLREINETSKWF